MLVDDRRQIWAGTRGEGLFRFMSYYFQPVNGGGNIGKEIYALYQGRDGKVWVGSENGLASNDGTNWNYYSTSDGLPPNAVRALAEDANGNLWIGTQGGGIFRLRDGKITPARAPVGDIACLLVDRDNVLWAGTSGHGLARFQNGSWMLFSTRDGLSTDNIGYLLEDGIGSLWIGSYEGVMRIRKTSLADYTDGTAKIVNCRTFLTQECALGAQPAAIRARDGWLWLPTTHGVVTVNPAALEPNLTPPPVVIESVLVDGVEQKTNRLSFGWGGVIELSPDNEQLEIHFASLNFSAPKGAQFGARFKYRLDGRDKNWTDIGSERVAHFNKLPPGDYTFRVNACNEDGVWNEAGAALEIHVAPPFWRKASFTVFFGLMLVGALAGIVYLISTAKLKRQLRAARQKELIEKERARIARDLHDQVGANLTQVALLGEMAEADKHLPEEIEQHAQQIYATARETTRSLDEIVWSLNSANDTLEGLANYACKYAQDYFALAGVSFRSELPALPATPIPPDIRHNVFLAFKEAVNNVVKHAQATEARVKLQLEPGRFVLTVADNGRGLGDLSGKQLRNGLKNMRKRLADIGGEFDVAPGEKGGTLVKLTVPLKSE
jgi:signal transduction histidine kinase